MKRLLRLLAFRSRAPRGPCVSPSPSPGCSPYAPCLKGPSSGNLRFCAFTAPPVPNLSGVIRGFALKPVLQARPDLKSRTATTASATPIQNHPNRCTVLQCVAACCTVFRPKISHTSGATPPKPIFGVGRVPSRGAPHHSDQTFGLPKRVQWEKLDELCEGFFQF